MDDLISRQAAIDAIEPTLKSILMGNSFKAINVIDKIRDLPSAQPEQRWIPVTEQLPKSEAMPYWVCTNTGYQCECRWTNNKWGLGESDEWDWKPFDIPQYSKVIAWMPLPEPWKEGEA